MKRAHVSLTTKLASALLALGNVPYEDAKLMTADQIISLYQFDHGVLHALGGGVEFWNLTPTLIAPHKRKSRKDTGIAAKVVRLDGKWREFTADMNAGRKPAKRKSNWGTRPLRSRSSWPKRQ